MGSLTARWASVIAGLSLAGLPAYGAMTFRAADLTISNTYSSRLFARVDIAADDALGTVRFTVTPFNVQPLYGNLQNFGIQSFGFNYDSGAVSALPADWTTNLPGDWTQSAPANGSNLSAFGRFAAVESGRGNSRQDPLQFTIRLPSGQWGQAVADHFVKPNSDGYMFAAHIAGYGNSPGSHWVAAQVVPAPGAALLGALGLALGVRLRRQG